MAKGAIDLEYLTYERANFAHSGREPTSADPLIEGPRPYYYMWRGHDGAEGMDIVRFEDSSDVRTAKLFRYTREQLNAGVSLAKDKPKYVGRKVVEVLEDYRKERIKLRRKLDRTAPSRGV